MEVPASSPTPAPDELPERYSPLIQYIASKLGGLNAALDSALRRVESRRFRAERKLRESLQGYWSEDFEDQVLALRPFDLLPAFQEYAVAVFRAAGEEFLTLFHDFESYRSFLDKLQDCVLEAILPSSTTLGREASEEEMLIGLDEPYGAFDERCPRRASGLASKSGDWKCVIDDSIVDALRKETRSTGPSLAGMAFMDALADEKNRKNAKEFWTVALERSSATLSATWWSTSADAVSKLANTEARDPTSEDGAHAPAEQEIRTSDLLGTAALDKSERTSAVSNSLGSSPESKQVSPPWENESSSSARSKATDVENLFATRELRLAMVDAAVKKLKNNKRLESKTKLASAIRVDRKKLYEWINTGNVATKSRSSSLPSRIEDWFKNYLK